VIFFGRFHRDKGGKDGKKSRLGRKAWKDLSKAIWRRYRQGGRGMHWKGCSAVRVFMIANAHSKELGRILAEEGPPKTKG